MYYLVFGFLYLVSLLPFFILYPISDFKYIRMYYDLEYKKEIFVVNILLAFPEKTLAERERIASQFCKNFVDTFIESIKLLFITGAEFEKRCTGIHGKLKIQLQKAEVSNWVQGTNLIGSLQTFFTISISVFLSFLYLPM